MSEFKSSNFTNENNTGGPDLVGITTLTSPHYFVPPSGTTAQRPSGDGLVPGMLRFNTDIGRLEVWRGDHWATILGQSPNIGISTNPVGTSGGTGARGIFGGGYTPARVNNIDYITISTLGNSLDFGDLISARSGNASCSSSTRGLFAGGASNSNFESEISYVTFSSTGNAVTFGELTSGGNRFLQGCSSSTRGLFGGGQGTGYSYKNNIDYVTISSTGSSVDFGDLLNQANGAASLSSPTRGIWTGGYNVPSANLINFVTISTTGNAVYFGDLSALRYLCSGCSNSTRGLFGGGFYPSPFGTLNTIDFINIASAGNAQDFGDLTVYCNSNASCSSPTRGVWVGGYVPSTPTNANNVIGYVTIATTGNAQDFGDLSGGFTTRGYFAACSNAHGGL